MEKIESILRKSPSTNTNSTRNYLKSATHRNRKQSNITISFPHQRDIIHTRMFSSTNQKSKMMFIESNEHIECQSVTVNERPIHKSLS